MTTTYDTAVSEIMNQAASVRATRLMVDLARRFNWETQPAAALLMDGNVCYLVHLHRGGDFYSMRNPVPISFYTDKTHGLRWIGLAGATVPAHKVIPYVAAVAEDPEAHPGVVNRKILGI